MTRRRPLERDELGAEVLVLPPEVDDATRRGGIRTLGRPGTDEEASAGREPLKRGGRHELVELDLLSAAF